MVTPPLRWTPESRAIDNLADAVRLVAAAFNAPPPGPCPSQYVPALFETPYARRCELRAGHAGDHEWHGPATYVRWSDEGATSRDGAADG